LLLGVINTNHEITFGLENKYDKDLLIAHEIGDNLSSRISSDIFKQMICGETLSIARKHKSEISVDWRVPLIICTNVDIPYTDSHGSISRRLAIFKFDQYVSNKNTNLEKDVITYELPAIIGKCLLEYRALLRIVDRHDFWSVCPDYFRENIRDMCENTNYLYMFLTLAPGDNIYGNKNVYFMHQPNSFMYLQDFKHKFLNYMRFRHPHIKYTWSSDYSVFKQLGYCVEQVNMCKACNAISQVNCCSQYNIANRTKRYIIKGLSCIETSVTDE